MRAQLRRNSPVGGGLVIFPAACYSIGKYGLIYLRTDVRWMYGTFQNIEVGRPFCRCHLENLSAYRDAHRCGQRIEERASCRPGFSSIGGRNVRLAVARFERYPPQHAGILQDGLWSAFDESASGGGIKLPTRPQASR